MRKCSLLVAALAALVMGKAEAGIAPLVDGVNNRFDYNNWEYTVDVNGDGKLSVGDRIHGVFQNQDLGNGPAGEVIKVLIGAGNPSLTGVFEVEVKDIVVTGGFISEVIFGPSSSGWNTALGLPAATMLAAYTDGNQDFNPTLGSDAAVEATIVDGTLIGAFGFEGNTGTYADGFWITSPILTTNIPLLPTGSPQIFYGLHILAGELDSATVNIATQVNPYIGDLFPLQQGVIYQANLPFDFVGRSQLTAITTGHYDTFSQDPALIDIKAVPEPASIAVFAGLFGGLAVVGAARRRRLA